VTKAKLRFCDSTGKRVALKRFFDISISLSFIVLTLPLFLATAISIRIQMGMPIFFRQLRAGHNGQTFELIKFRTMTMVTDPEGNFEPDAARLTKLGRFLRANSLDEIPSLWNVLKGEMSLVGPRPLLPEYTKLYGNRFSKRLALKPGVTGWAQVNGRNLLQWEEKFELDIWYVENQSALLDFKILILTFKEVLRKRGIMTKYDETMPPFAGF
jgi:lipopolysaccharide/colanic/teichoic acid biosynthesis glycosyltransferase